MQNTPYSDLSLLCQSNPNELGPMVYMKIDPSSQRSLALLSRLGTRERAT